MDHLVLFCKFLQYLKISKIDNQILTFLFFFLEPRFEDLKSDGFHGLVKENERRAIVSPRIKVVGGKLKTILIKF